ncbi:MAG TPA: hypothetical protein VHP11_01245 [Tepidisphaeraceae bacterium]|nr:hypothetical protein [Tepidisphaeraceae bacterium]
MRKFFTFILIGLLVSAFPGEISNQLLIHQSARAFWITMLSYVWFLALGFGVGRLLDWAFGAKFPSRLTYFFLYGCVGLMIEWFLLGVYPLQPNPVQLMMFTFWASMMLTPRIFIDEPATEELNAIRRGILRYIVIWSAISLLPFVITALFIRNHMAGPRAFSILVFGVGALGMNYYFYRYFRLLKSQTRSVSGFPVVSTDQCR